MSEFIFIVYFCFDNIQQGQFLCWCFSTCCLYLYHCNQCPDQYLKYRDAAFTAQKKKQYNDNESKKGAPLCCLCGLKSCTMKDSSEGAFLLHLNRAATRTNNPLNLQHLLAGQVHLDFGGADVCVPS